MNITSLVVDYLNSCDLGAVAYPERPSKASGALMTVELVGIQQPNPVQLNPSVMIDCWADTRQEAEALADDVRHVMLAMPAKVANIFHAEIDSFYNNRDPDSGCPRYTVGVDLTANE